jgi:hypothetical protein
VPGRPRRTVSAVVAAVLAAAALLVGLVVGGGGVALATFVHDGVGSHRGPGAFADARDHDGDGGLPGGGEGPGRTLPRGSDDGPSAPRDARPGGAGDDAQDGVQGGGQGDGGSSDGS